MGGEERELSEGSYTNNNPSPNSDCVLEIDLDIHQTYLSILSSHQDQESGNPRVYQESHIRVPALVLPGNMSRDSYYSSFHKWLHSLHLDYPLGDDMVWDFTYQVLDSVFEKLDLLHHQNVAMCVSANLHRAPLPLDKDNDDEEEAYDPIMEEDEEEEDDDPIMEEYDPVEEDEEEDDGERLIKGYRAQCLTFLYGVVAAEEHCKLGDCLICLYPLFSVNIVDREEEEGKKDKYLFESPCGHYFHEECMSEWLTRSVSCPLCRFHISLPLFNNS